MQVMTRVSGQESEAALRDALAGQAQRLVVVYVAPTIQFWLDLPQIAAGVPRDSLVLVLAFRERLYGPFRERAEEALGTELPRFVTNPANFETVQGAIWFRDGQAEMQPNSETDWKVAGVAAGGRNLLFVLLPAVRQAGMGWKDLEHPRMGPWMAKVYGPLPVLAGLTWLFVWMSLHPASRPDTASSVPAAYDGEAHVAQHRHEEQQIIDQGGVDIPAKTTHLTDDQVAKLAELQTKLYGVGDLCNFAAQGTFFQASNKALAKLSAEDVDAYFPLQIAAMRQPEQPLKNLAKKQVAAFAKARTFMTPEELKYHDEIYNKPDDQTTSEENCRFNGLFVKEYPKLSPADVTLLARAVGF